MKTFNYHSAKDVKEASKLSSSSSAFLAGGMTTLPSMKLGLASYMDYTMPRADDLPEFNLGFTCTKATTNPLGVKGCGEAGTIAATPTVMNAVINALGGKEISLPATAEKVWKACKELQKSYTKAA